MRFYLFVFAYLSLMVLSAQVTATADGDSGSGYPALVNAGFEIEDPDCEHTDFGSHITQAYDDELDRNVFVFHSHIDADNDRCIIFDRVRMEIKGSTTTIPELQHNLGDTTYYRWKFRLDENFVGASSFNHLFQNKIKGGNDDSFPVITLTARASILEVKHNGGDTGVDLGTLATADLNRFTGEWVEVYLRQVHSENGELDITIRDMSTGLTILEYSNGDIDLWRDGATISRPKFGVYRSKNVVVQDEEVRFADFCVSEVSEDLCPAEAVLVPDTEAPSVPTNLIITSTTFTTIGLAWNESSDEYGVTAYEVFADGSLVATTENTETTVGNLLSNTSYSFEVRAIDAANNQSAFSIPVIATTDDATATPGPAHSPQPDDGAIDVNPGTGIGWTTGPNTDEFEVFFGTEIDPPSVSVQTVATYQPVLEANTTYFWRIASSNVNGAVTSPVWTFTTGESNSDLPWYMFRGNARPETETNFFELNIEPDAPLLDEVFPDPDFSGNNIYGYRTDTDNFKWRFDLGEQDSTITMVARIKGIDDNANGMIHLEVRAFGWRQKVRINDGNIKLERTDNQLEVDLPFNWNNDYHIVRVVATGPSVDVYLDENETPIISGVSNTTTTTTYIEFGRSGGANYGALIDWLGISITEASAPDEGTPLPDDLFPPVATVDPVLQSLVKVYPNPSKGKITLELPEEGRYLAQIYGMDGRTIGAGTVRSVSNGETLELNELPGGTYLLLISDQNGKLARVTIRVE